MKVRYLPILMLSASMLVSLKSGQAEAGTSARKKPSANARRSSASPRWHMTQAQADQVLCAFAKVSVYALYCDWVTFAA